MLTAEGGTEYGHAATMARSKNITGPYEISPHHPFITSRNHPDYHLQKSGHADLVQTKEGNWMAVFLTARPLTSRGLCILGRETSIETVDWPAGEWPLLGSGSSVPRLQFSTNGNDVNGISEESVIYHFEKPELDIDFQSLRIPVTEDWASLKSRPGFLTLTGRESLSSLQSQSLLARRVQSYNMEAETALDFSPKNFQQLAGLVCYYNTAHFHYVHITADDGGRRCLQIITHDHFEHREAFEEPVLLPDTGIVFLKASLYGKELQFFYGLKEKQWKKAGPVLNAGILSDDYVREGGTRYRPAFTGTFVGICCQDLSGSKIQAQFDWFAYKEEEYFFETEIQKKNTWKEKIQ